MEPLFQRTSIINLVTNYGTKFTKFYKVVRHQQRPKHEHYGYRLVLFYYQYNLYDFLSESEQIYHLLTLSSENM